ncbi:MAG: 4a-hydroxytetrahydrobiopterin dehydratase [Gammaproteobacteria bacterium]|nr:4a-hydroxytetrahydrobiopterin dehydratase [Gammaproteobacteria bacterium]
MKHLANESLASFENSTVKLLHSEIVELQRQLPSWQCVSSDGVDKLVRIYTFGNFREALEFTIRIGELAEEVDHHPTLLTEWGRSTVTWWTHSLEGLQRKDFMLAAKTDQLYEQ